jgi:alpha-beta hydrolase superfamily lysophospholipase
MSQERRVGEDIMNSTPSFTFTDQDGFEIFVHAWLPDGAPQAILQIAHGAVEHGARYQRFGEFLNEHGYAVYAPDHRGHGKTASTLERAGKAGEDGWNGIVEDFAQLTSHIREEYPDLPLFVLGHSMGSIIAQQYMQEYPKALSGVILSGSWGSLGDTDELVAGVEAAIAAEGRDGPSMLLAEMFGSFNEPFGGTTGFEWLSRDQDEVQKYVDDPWCGSFAFSNGFVLDFFKAMGEMWRPESEARIPKSLPVMIASGDKDPAGGFSETTKILVDRYRALGLEDLTVKFYPEARHEILNETIRDRVQADMYEWMSARIG